MWEASRDHNSTLVDTIITLSSLIYPIAHSILTYPRQTTLFLLSPAMSYLPYDSVIQFKSQDSTLSGIFQARWEKPATGIGGYPTLRNGLLRG
ncbi:hypothetical protein BDR04DRAFT_230575 [Suillus decipiens]|nr:hypothetical protein BDR04DRAFT_230575 [Suillus decipiens]